MKWISNLKEELEILLLLEWPKIIITESQGFLIKFYFMLYEKQ